MQTPLLIITFNRPSNTLRVLESLRSVKPQNLYVFQDGPREGNPNDMEKCIEVRKILETSVDWPCNVYTNYQEKNLGCGHGPYEAISWLFRNVEKGIILEDDVFPHPLFFPYMEDLLERYKDDDRVGMVTGHNLQRHYSRRNSYYFTHEMAGTYGWGTWRRVWENFDFDIPYDEKLFAQAMRRYGLMRLYIQKSSKLYKQWMYGKDGSRHDFWDYQFDYYLIVHNYLNARANSCLTSHEGFGEDATHLTARESANYLMEVNESRFTPITHPDKVQIDKSVRYRMLKSEVHLLLKKIMNK